MKTITNLHDLAPFGVNPLTGEADAYCMRLLCDLNEDGAYLIRRFLGLPADLVLNKNWNSQVNEKPAVASIMLTRDCLWEIAKFALFAVDHCDYIIKTGSGLTGLHSGEEYTPRYLELAQAHPEQYGLYRNPTTGSTQPRVGDRNVHAFSGRVE